jgi:hypothetical protein
MPGALDRLFGRLKEGHNTVYPLPAQLMLLMEGFAVGEHRPFGIEALSADPVFVHLAGGVIPSLDTVYRDLARFDDEAIGALDALVAEHGLELVRQRTRQAREIHLDIDTTVTPVFGEAEGALPGPNPRYRGRPSYHPILARVAETDTIVGAQLRPGDRAFGVQDAATIAAWIDRLREAVGPKAVIHTRIDAAADCAEVLKAISDRGSYFTVKARLTQDLLYEVAAITRWRTIDWDADGKPSLQVADIPFERRSWREVGVKVRAVAVRTLERDIGKQVKLWELDDYSVQVFLTNEFDCPAQEVARRYNGRAGVEPLIAEMKNGYGIGAVPSASFHANHAALLLKMLVHNLLRRFVADRLPTLRAWRVAWLRRVLIRVPGRIIRHGRGRTLRLPPASALHQLE